MSHLDSDIEDDFRQVLAKFKNRLSLDEQQAFKLTTLGDLGASASALQDEQKKRKTARNLRKIQPFLQAMTQYSGVIEVFLNTSEILCFVWGPMKFLLNTASRWEKSFDVLLDAYKQLADNFPLLLQYRSMFEANEHMKQVLKWIYDDILQFHLKALRVFTQPAWKQFFSATWKDFQESTKPVLSDLLRHRELIERTASLQQIQESRDARDRSQASFAALETEQRGVKVRTVITWLNAADSAQHHDDCISVREHNTGSSTWILGEAKVKEWLDPSKATVPLFWLSGKPGAGKTILSSVIIENVLQLVDKKEPSLAYFYCKDGDAQRSKFTAVAKAMIAQLLQQNSDKHGILAYLYDQCLKSCKVTLSSTQDCERTLFLVLLALPKTYIVIDGIDECEPKERRLILRFFSSVVNKEGMLPGKVRSLFVSQDLHDIKSALYGVDNLHLNEQHNMADIRDYTTKFANSIQQNFLERAIPLPNEARDHIVNLVCEGADGMFLFAKLVLNNLQEQENLENLYRELRYDIFPHGFDQAYKRIVTRIFGNPNTAQRNTAHRLLSWITCAKRPLKLQEIRGACSIDTAESRFNFEGRKLLRDIGEICGSLIEILSSNRIQLVHTTAKHYLLQHTHIDEQKEEIALAVLCLKYLTLDCFDSDLSESETKNFLLQGHYSFLDYASIHWTHHLEAGIQSMTLEQLHNSADLGIALNEFIVVHEPKVNAALELEYEKSLDDFTRRCGAIETGQSCGSLVLLLSHAKASRHMIDQLQALGSVGMIIDRVREMLKCIGRVQSLDPSIRQKLQNSFGYKWYKCHYHACYYFHEGFEKENTLLQHTNRHDKPFCCTELGCTRMYIGWSSEKELKKHMNQFHPDPNAFAWKFPHVKKPPTIFQCDRCNKQFSRANILKTHKASTHEGLRPYLCKTCNKGFARQCDCSRHERIHTHQSSTNPGSAEDGDRMELPRPSLQRTNQGAVI